MSVRATTAARFVLFPASAFLAWLAVTTTWWAIAFPPLAAPPEWIERARAVCFGTLPNGLPDNYGWCLLVLGPLSMLAFLVVVWGGELRASARWALGRAAGASLLGALAGGLALGVFGVAQRVERALDLGESFSPSEAVEPLPEGYLRTYLPAPELGLVDQSGSTLRLSDLRGRIVLLSFAFAHCRTVCPVLIHTLRQASSALPENAAAIVVVTLDPWRDTPRALPGIAESWKLGTIPGAHVLSGEIADVGRVHREYEIGATRDETTGDILHPGLIYLLDGEGRIAYRFLNPPPDWLVEAVTRLGRETA